MSERFQNSTTFYNTLSRFLLAHGGFSKPRGYFWEGALPDGRPLKIDDYVSGLWINGRPKDEPARREALEAGRAVLGVSGLALAGSGQESQESLDFGVVRPEHLHPDVDFIRHALQRQVFGLGDPFNLAQAYVFESRDMTLVADPLAHGFLGAVHESVQSLL